MSLHDDIVRYIHEFEYNGYKVKIVERERKRFVGGEKFLHFYVLDENDKERGGMYYSFFDNVTEEDLADLSIAVPKIKLCIDDKISTNLKWAQEKIQRKIELNWKGQSFKRGDFVYFKGNDNFRPCKSYVWTHYGHLRLEYYLIEHEDGHDRSNWMAKPPFENRDGFECVHSSQLKEGLKYIQINCSEEFQGETDELELVSLEEQLITTNNNYNKIKIQLVDRNKEMCEQWASHFKDCADVTVHCADFFSLKTDCVVSPANSFGYMDGGLDLAISKKIGWQVQEKLQKQIREKYLGELLVGQAELVETDFEEIPFCISAPTMRVPLVLENTVNVYLASKAIFDLLKKEKRIETVTISGLGTGVGQLPYDVCAKQMKKAYDDVWLDQYVFPESWDESQKQHQLLYSDSFRDLQY